MRTATQLMHKRICKADWANEVLFKTFKKMYFTLGKIDLKKSVYDHAHTNTYTHTHTPQTRTCKKMHL